ALMVDWLDEASPHHRPYERVAWKHHVPASSARQDFGQHFLLALEGLIVHAKPRFPFERRHRVGRDVIRPAVDVDLAFRAPARAGGERGGRERCTQTPAGEVPAPGPADLLGGVLTGLFHFPGAAGLS